MSKATCEVVCLRRIIDDVRAKQEGPTKVHCDNQSAIKLAHKPVYHGRSKHIELQPHFAREETKYKEIELVYCNTNANVVDIFTNRVGNIHF